MILKIPINPIANQRLNVVLNQQNCTITLLSRNGNTFLSLFLNNDPVIQSRKLSLTPVIPYRYMKSNFEGNLTIVNNDLNPKDNPDYTKFGISQSLYYYTEDI